MFERNRLPSSPDPAVAVAPLPSPQAFVMVPMPGAPAVHPFALLQVLQEWVQARAATSQASLCQKDWLAVWN
jgi:hypothetical protein